MGWNPMRVIISFFSYEFVQHNLYNPIRTVQIVYNLKRTNSLIFVRIRIKSYNFYTNCIVRVHTKFLFFVFSKSVQTSRERAARAARAKPELQARSASREGEARAHLLPQPGRTRLPRPLGYTRLPRPIRVHSAAPTN